MPDGYSYVHRAGWMAGLRKFINSFEALDVALPFLVIDVSVAIVIGDGFLLSGNCYYE